MTTAEKIRKKAQKYAEEHDGELSEEIQEELDSLGDDAVKAELVLLPEINLAEVFSPKGIEPIIKAVATKVRSFEYDVEDPEGRKEIASLRMKVSKSKTFIEKASKKYIEQMEEQAKGPLENIANAKAAMKVWRESMDELRDEARQPLTDYENRLKAEEEARKLARQKVLDEEEAYELEELYQLRRLKAQREAEVEALARKEEEEAQRRVRDEEVRQQAILDAQRQAEEKERSAKAEAERRIAEAKAEAECAKREAAEAQARAKAEYEQKERERLAEEQRIKDEAARRAADIEHKRQINNEILTDMADVLIEIPVMYYKAIVAAIAKGEIRHITINY